MIKDFQLPVSGDLLGKLVAGIFSADGFLSELFGIDQNNENLHQGLASYFYDNGGSPEVREFDIVDAKFDTANLSGEFKCVFIVYYFFTCSDVKNQKRETITWNYKINKDNLTIAFTGEEPWVIE